MALPLITAIRACRDLKESVLHTALELAHRASIYGVARVSYTFLAEKCHCSRQTIINHVKILIAHGILRKTVRWITNNFCEINQYTFTIPWHATLSGTPLAAQPSTCSNAGPTIRIRWPSFLRHRYASIARQYWSAGSTTT